MHSGLNRPDFEPDDGYSEARRAAEELAGLELEPPDPSPVALVFDYEAHWVLRTHPQGSEVGYCPLVFAFYSALRSLGLDVDVVAPGDPLEGRRLVVVPILPIARPEALAALERAGCPVVFGPRTGSKTESFSIPENLPPGPLQRLIPLKVTRVESLRPGLEEPFEWGGRSFEAGVWGEWVESRLEPAPRFADGRGAVYAHEDCHYLPFWPTPEFLATYLEQLAAGAGLEPRRLPEGLRLRRRGGVTFALNFTARPLEAPAPVGARFTLGGSTVEPYGVSAWR
jgi:beta-galactosidase